MPVAHIIGLGRSGVAAARLLKREGWEVSVSDAGESSSLAEQQRSLALENIPVILGCRFSLETLVAEKLKRPDRIVVSPGVSWQLPALVAAREQGIEVLGELELAWRFLQHCPWVGITGTNGKTTTTALVEAIFRAAGLKAPACGNIGYSACEVALSGQPVDWIIAEVSSYQIESSPTLAPQIGVWTTFTPDHLERHGTLENYRDIKAALLNRSGYKILNGDDPYLLQHFPDRWPEAQWTSTQGSALSSPSTPSSNPSALTVRAYIEGGWVMVSERTSHAQTQAQKIVPVDALRMPGAHNQQNLLLAIAVAHQAGIEAEAIAQAVASFPGVAHRLEYIQTHQGVTFINDSKATNYDAAQTGLAAVDAPAILIAGGSPKVGDDTLWIETIQAKAAAVLLIGDAAPAFAQRLQERGYTAYEIVETLENAVPRAAELAQLNQAKVVLLSPACASFDQYQNFEQRGDHFRQLCQTLLSSPEG
ncbi:MAG: UDP-N-acetylmuramoyl-L-alanine--D-glutamate ligase [Thermosynechococcaceae cyanobacterium MS004]|nr:UDP-N-acetylmuramoyl-L-alanine--D-glutamate ligase [Thermosynechococcaceae cyanobacterium MS004]